MSIDLLYLTSYRHPDTGPFGNIMLLPEAEAYQKAAQLAGAHPETTAFYRFADFANYYPAARPPRKPCASSSFRWAASRS